jgi:hypothetical protein
MLEQYGDEVCSDTCYRHMVVLRLMMKTLLLIPIKAVLEGNCAVRQQTPMNIRL